MGLKPGGVRGSLRNVSVGTLAIPDYTVDHRYIAESFASPWPDESGSADMTVNGLTASTFSNGETSVAGDGSSDHGVASGPQTYGSLETFGIAFTAQIASISGFSSFCGAIQSTGIQIRSGVESAGGDIELRLDDDSGNSLNRFTSSAYDDGNEHAVIINKSGNTASDIEIFVDDMATPAGSSSTIDTGFDNTNFSLAIDMAFFARNFEGSIDGHTDMDAGVFEFKPSPYSQSEREAFVEWRPEVS